MKRKLPKVFQAFINSVHGLRFAWEDHSYRNSCYQFAVGVVIASALTAMWQLSAYSWLLLVGSLFPMVITEAVNTSIEAVTDKASPEKSLLAKKAKDIGSAAVLLSRILAILCWVVVLVVQR